MKKSVRNYLIGFVMFLLALFEGVSGLILWLVLSRGGGYRGGRGLATEATFIWSRDTWIVLHDWVGVALAIIVVLHIILHWKWIVYMTKRLCLRQKE
jgi:hypothetical protein